MIGCPNLKTVNIHFYGPEAVRFPRPRRLEVGEEREVIVETKIGNFANQHSTDQPPPHNYLFNPGFNHPLLKAGWAPFLASSHFNDAPWHMTCFSDLDLDRDLQLLRDEYGKHIPPTHTTKNPFMSRKEYESGGDIARANKYVTRLENTTVEGRTVVGHGGAEKELSHADVTGVVALANGAEEHVERLNISIIPPQDRVETRVTMMTPKGVRIAGEITHHHRDYYYIDFDDGFNFPKWRDRQFTIGAIDLEDSTGMVPTLLKHISKPLRIGVRVFRDVRDERYLGTVSNEISPTCYEIDWDEGSHVNKLGRANNGTPETFSPFTTKVLLDPDSMKALRRIPSPATITSTPTVGKE